ncbi:hypothetical protein RB195_003640 [Necator americanus]|uniref:Uncharacterized protein n=1 Tax=Necator americanus TaxID=51031 RepID=A0ABR1DQT8_NECAM
MVADRLQIERFSIWSGQVLHYQKSGLTVEKVLLPERFLNCHLALFEHFSAECKTPDQWSNAQPFDLESNALPKLEKKLFGKKDFLNCETAWRNGSAFDSRSKGYRSIRSVVRSFALGRKLHSFHHLRIVVET